MKIGVKKSVSLLLICVLVFGMLPGTVFAEESGGSNKVSTWFSNIVQTVKEVFEVDGEGNESSQKAEFEIDSSDPLMANSEVIQASEVEGDYGFVVVDGGVEIKSYYGSGGNITIPETIAGKPVISIGIDAFNSESSLISVILPESLTVIDGRAFYYCKNLTKVELPNSLTIIGGDAFFGCSNLKNVRLPESLIEIGMQAFAGCSSLMDIFIPDSVTNIYYYAFSDCENLMNISVSENNLNYKSVDGVLYDKIGSILIKCPGGKYSVNVIDGCTKVDEDAFVACEKLTNVILPDSLANIGYSSFGYCSSLTSVIIPESVISIDSYAFAHCSKLENMIIPNSVSSIGEYAFLRCSSLKTIQFNSRETIIEGYNYINPTIPHATTIIGYDPSTAKDYADTYGNPFQLIGTDPEEPDPTPETDQFNLFTVNENKLAFSIKDIDTQSAIEGAAVLVDGQSITSGSSGLAVYDDPDTGIHDFTVQCSGYLDYQSSVIFKRGGMVNIYLQKDTGDDLPYLTQVDLSKGTMAAADVRQNEFVFVGSSNESQLTDFDYGIIEMKANLRGKTLKRYILSQNGKVVMESDTGIFDRVALAQVFDAGDPIYAMVETTDGSQSRAVETQIVIMSATARGSWGFDSSGNGALQIGQNMGFTIPGNLPVIGGMDVSSGMDLLPGSIIITPDTFKVAIGTQNASDYLASDDNWTKFKKSIEEAKTATNRIKKMDDLLASFGGNKIGTTLTSGFEAGTDAVGYFEGVFIDGRAVVTKSSMLVNISGKYSQQNQYLIAVGPVPVPLYTELSAGIESELSAAIASIIPESGQAKLDTEFKLTPSFELGGGAGVVGLITAGVAGKAELELLTRFADDYQRGILTGSMSLKATALCFEAKQEIARGSWTIFERIGIMANTGIDSSLQASQHLEFDIYDIAQYSLMSRDYAEISSIWTGGDGITTQTVDYTNQTLKVLQTNIYPDAQPLLTEVDGKEVMVWLADNTSRSDANRTMLVYSICDQSTGIWSEPAAISDDGTADFYPQLGCDGDSLYVTWQNSKITLADDVTLTDAAKAGEIAVAKFDAATSTFTGITTLTDNDVLDTQPQLAVSGSQVGLIWTSNDQNDLFGSSGRNTLYYVQLSGSNWSSTQTLLADQNAITAIAAGYVNGTLTAAYTPDEDNDLNTITDRDLYTLGVGQSANRLTNDEVLDSNPVFAGFSGTDSLFWYHDGNIDYVPISNLNVTPATIFDENKEGFSDSFTIVNNAAGKTAAIWTQTQDEMTEIYGSLYDGSAWSNDIRISDVGSRIMFPCGIFDNDGNFNIAFNRLTIGEDNSDQSDLCTLMVVPSYNLTMSEPYFEDADIIPAAVLPVEIDVTNSGALAVDQICVEVLDGSISNNTQTISEPIQPGETKTITALINLPDSIYKKDYTIKVTPAAGDEYDLSDNQKNITIGYTDLSLSLQKYYLGDEGGIVVKTQLSNLSYVATDATLKVTEDTADGTVLYTQNLSEVKQGENCFATFNLNPKTLSFTSDIKQIYVSVTASGEEISTGDNSDFIVLDNPLNSTATLNSIAVTTPASKTNYSVGDALDLSGLVVIGTYSDGSTKEETVTADNITGFDSSKVATDQILTITIDGKTATFTIQITDSNVGQLGDVDGNGSITAYDALMALQIATGKKQGTAEEISAADVDGNVGVGSYDALKILQYATGKILTF